MEVENSEKVKKERKGPIKSLSLANVPRSVHNVMTDYQKKIIGERRKFFTVKQAYVEFLKEHTKNLVV